MSAFSAAAQDEDGDTIKALRARVASLEALLCGEPGFYITLPRSVVEQALEALNSSMPHNNDMDHDWPSHIAARRALRAALEQPQVEQEPVAWIENIGGGVSYNPYHEAARKLPDGVRFDLYTHPQNLNCKSNQARLATLWGYEKKQPPRQPLTDGQINDYRLALAYDSEDLPDPWDFREGFRAAERSHRIGGEK